MSFCSTTFVDGTKSEFQNEIYRKILKDVASRDSDLSSEGSLKQIPVTFIMATTAVINLGKLLEDADSAFADMNFRFEPYDTLIVDNTQFYHLDDNEEGAEEGMELRKEYFNFHSLNVYIVDTLVSREGTTTQCGVLENYGFANWITLSNSSGGVDSVENNYTFIHELGHHFCLYHTNRYTPNAGEDCIIAGERVELVNGFECDSRGDELCDTPADPNLYQNANILVNEDCTFNNSMCQDFDTFSSCLQTLGDFNDDGSSGGFLDNIACINEGNDCCALECECKDANGDPYAGIDADGDSYSPDTKNFMSLTIETCADHFTPEQKNVIITRYDNYELNRYLDCSWEYMGNDWFCAGCMEQSACNYEPEALIEDYSCEFPLEGYNCEGEELSKNGKIIPENYLFSIYPNPFNPIATISFSISQFMGASITVCDITGRRLETLINTNLNPGNHSLDWNASNYPSGVYFISMDSGEFKKTQKVVLLK